VEGGWELIEVVGDRCGQRLKFQVARERLQEAPANAIVGELEDEVTLAARKKKKEEGGGVSTMRK
jgi:hypothetical protein